MTVTRKYGKHEITVHGTSKQIREAIAEFVVEVNDSPLAEICNLLRQKAIEVKLEGAADIPILEVAKALMNGIGPCNNYTRCPRYS